MGGSCGILPSWAPRRLQLGIVQPRLLTAGRVADPDSIGSVDPDPGGQKSPTKVEIFFKVHVLKCVGWPLLRSEGSFCNLDVLYGGGLGIGKL